MRKWLHFEISDVNIFKENILHCASGFSRAGVLQSNEYNGSETEMLVALDCAEEIICKENCFDMLKNFYESKQDWLFGFLSYPASHLQMDTGGEAHFFQPKYVFIVRKNKVEIGFLPEVSLENEIENLFYKILNFSLPPVPCPLSLEISQRISKQDYIQTITRIKKHIQRGDIYEMNYCMEFFSDTAEINPAEVFLKLNETSQAPFSAFYRRNNNYLLCASPERFLKKEGKKIISQPIKGTARRGKTFEEDLLQKEKLANSVKDKSENVMIVDLVRNDLSRTCENVKTEELFGIYSFKQWHQMISTVSGEMKDGVHFTGVIKNAFPMGSMTGAPKLSAMKLIDKFEKTKRGLYSGAVGYITPEGDFDFNVVIRSILYNSVSNYLSFSVGGAITANSIPEEEYEECLLKAKGMFSALGAENPKSEKTNSKEYQNSLV
ncbi:MAG: anthranilate synthase component I family protein [Bacteroidetes bacterium]|nr:anthranilate synthase component I family protein [Bacteroidota bacterium]